MTRDETATVAAMVRMLWPHSVMDPRTPDIWHPLLERLNLQDVEEAVRELAATGREHSPVIGLIVRTVAERQTELPDWDTAWVEVQTLVRRFGSYRVPEPEHFSHPVVAAFAIPAWVELCTAPAPGVNGHGMHYAQQRDAYQAMQARAKRDVALTAVGAPRRKAPGLARPDYLAAIPSPSTGQEAA